MPRSSIVMMPSTAVSRMARKRSAESRCAEPPGLAVGKVLLRDGSVVLGVIGEPFLCEGQHEITSFGGWRAYMASKR